MTDAPDSLPPLNAKQREVMKIIRDAPFNSTTIAGYGGSLGGGKMVDVNLPIPTPSGWKLNGDIEDGDLVFDERGSVQVVVKAHPIDPSPESYRVHFDGGQYIDACADHLWLTFDRSELVSWQHRKDSFREARRAKRSPRSTGKRPDLALRNSQNPVGIKPPPTGTVRNTRGLFETQLTAAGHTNHAIPVAGALELPEANLPLDPYLFGCWLGDGTSSAASITSADQEILDAFANGGFKVVHRDRYTYGTNGLLKPLRALGVVGNKHIPTAYLRASIDQRMALLQGLMDTDGCAIKGRAGVEFTSVKKDLAEDVHDLIVGLGWKATIQTGVATLNGREIGPKYRIKWTPDKYVFRLRRKLEAQQLGTRSTLKWHYITKIERIDPVPMRCLTVTGDSHLYLAGRSMIPTHNTHLIVRAAMAIALANPGAKILIGRLEFNKLKTTTMAEFDKFFPTGANNLVVQRHDTDNWRKIRQKNWPDDVYSTIHFRGVDNWEGFGSEQFTAVLLDEGGEIGKMSAAILITRLRHPLHANVVKRFKAANPEWGHRYFFIAASNPYPGWFSDWFVQGRFAEDIDDPNINLFFVPSRMEDNEENLPANYREVTIAALRQTNPDMIARFVEGRFDAYSEQVYGEVFSKDVHRWNGPPPGKDEAIRVVGGLDFGGARADAHFTSGIAGVITKSGRLIRVAEFKDRGPGVDERHMAWMIATQARWCQPGQRIHWVGDKTQHVGIRAYRMMGFDIVLSRGEEIEVGINRVARWLLPDDSGIPGSFYLPELRKWEEEIYLYRWDTTKNENSPAKRYPIKRNDDLCLVAGTMVRTPNGCVPIADLRVGDVVVAGDGSSASVLASGISGLSVPVVRVTFEDGGLLCGTANHEVLSPTGLVSLGQLAVGDVLVADLWYTSKYDECADFRMGRENLAQVPGLSLAGPSRLLAEPPFPPDVFAHSYLGVYPREGSEGDGCPPRRSRSVEQFSGESHGDIEKRSHGAPSSGKRTSKTGVPTVWGRVSEKNHRTPEDLLLYKLQVASPLGGRGRQYRGDVRRLWKEEDGEQIPYPRKVQPLRKVAKIEHSFAKEVYDITIDHPSHLFWANGVATHNCDADRYMFEKAEFFVGSPDLLRNALATVRQ